MIVVLYAVCVCLGFVGVFVVAAGCLFVVLTCCGLGISVWTIWLVVCNWYFWLFVVRYYF